MMLTAFELWMIEQQMDYIKIHGIVRVMENLRNQG